MSRASARVARARLTVCILASATIGIVAVPSCMSWLSRTIMNKQLVMSASMPASLSWTSWKLMSDMPNCLRCCA